MQRRLHSVLILFVLLCMFSFTMPADAAIKLADEPEADPAVMQELQKGIDAFNDILYKEIQVTLEKPVTVYFCPTREIYEARLVSLLHNSKELAAREAHATGGISGGDVILLNGAAGNGKTAAGRAQLVSHELFHQVQRQLMSGSKNPKPLKWMQEGTADYVASRVCELRGYQSQDKWKLERINILRVADKHVSASAILEINMDGWVKLMEDKQHPYEMSDLMVFYLASQVKGNFYAAVKDYYERLGKGEDGGNEAFLHAFGLSLAEYLSGFSSWYMSTALDEAKIEVINYQDNASAAAVETATRAGELTRAFLVAKFGQDIQTSQRVVLTASDGDYVAAISKEFGYSAEVAQQKAQNTTIIFQGNTFIYKAANIGAFNLADMLTLRYLLDLAPEKHLKNLYWLYYGCGLVAGAQVNELAGINTVEKYRDGLLRALGTASTRPSLQSLANLTAWTESGKKYTTTANNRVAALASLYIAEKYGLASFSAWCKAVKELEDPEQAFVKTYGMSTQQFATEFEAYLKANLHK